MSNPLCYKSIYSTITYRLYNVNKNFIPQIILVFLISTSLAACSTISIKESSFLRDQQQVVLYYLTRFGPSTADQVAENTAYPVTAIKTRLEKLEDKQLVVVNSGKWSISEQYRQNERQDVQAIENYNDKALQDSLEHHNYSTRIIQPNGFQMASFIAESANQTLVVFPGNGFNLVPDALALENLLEPHRNVFVMEYPGMGDSKGDLTIDSLRDAASKFFTVVSKHPSVENTEIAVYGFSLGGFVATEVATSFEIDALILDSTAPDMQSWIDANVPLYAKAFVNVEADNALTQVNNSALLKDLTYPMLFIVGSDDNITPPSLVESLYSSAEKSTDKNFVLLDGVGHGGSLDQPEFKASIDTFMNKLTK